MTPREVLRLAVRLLNLFFVCLTALLASCTDQSELNTRDGIRFSCRRAADRIGKMEKLFAEYSDAQDASARRSLLSQMETQLYFAGTDITYIEKLDATRKMPEVEAFRRKFQASQALRSKVAIAFRTDEVFKARPGIADDVELALTYPLDSKREK